MSGGDIGAGMSDFTKGIREVARKVQHERHLSGWQHKSCPNPDCGKGECRRGYITPQWTDHHAYGEDTHEGEKCPTCRGAARVKVPATKAQKRAAYKREIKKWQKLLDALDKPGAGS